MSEKQHDKIEVGQDVGAFQYRLTPWRILKYVDTTRDDNPWHRGDSPFGGIVAPAAIFDSDVLRFPGLRKIVDPHPIRFIAGQDYEFINPCQVGKLIFAKGYISDTYIKGDKKYVVFEGSFTDEDDRDLAKMRLTYCWPVEE